MFEHGAEFRIKERKARSMSSPDEEDEQQKLEKKAIETMVPRSYPPVAQAETTAVQHPPKRKLLGTLGWPSKRDGERQKKREEAEEARVDSTSLRGSSLAGSAPVTRKTERQWQAARSAVPSKEDTPARSGGGNLFTRLTRSSTVSGQSRPQMPRHTMTLSRDLAREKNGNCRLYCSFLCLFWVFLLNLSMLFMVYYLRNSMLRALTVEQRN